MNTPSESLLHYLRRLTAPAASETSDAFLLERFTTQRDESAFTALLVRHGPMVLSVCRRILRNSHDAEDAFQATFLVLARKAGVLRRPEALASWLYGTARHLASTTRRTELRRLQRETLYLKPEDYSAPRDLLDDLSARELLLALEEELERLPEKYRLPLILCYLEGRTREEAARLLGWTAGAVKGRLERGRKLLQARLTRRGLGLGASLLALESMATATVSATLRQATVQRALSFAAGSAEGIATNILTLVETGVASMAMTKAKVGLGLLLTMALVAGTGSLVYSVRTEKQVEPKQAPAPQQPKRETVKPARTDALGDPLPPGAIARMGTLRLYHFGAIYSLVFSPDSKIVASAGTFGDIRLWDAANGKQVRTIRAYKEPFSGLVFSPDGRLLISACLFEPMIRVWETATGKELHRMPGDPKGNTALALSRDGKLLASAGRNRSIRLWDTAVWKELRRLTGHEKTVASLAFAPDSKTLISGSEDGAIRIWDAERGREIRRFSVGSRGLNDMALSPDGKILAIRRHFDGLVDLWDVAEGKLLRQLQAEKGRGIDFSPDGKRLATTGDDQFFRLWDVAAGKELRRVKEFTCSGKVAYAPNGKLLACSTAANAGEISLRDPTTGMDILNLRNRETLASVSFSEDGKTLRTSDTAGVLTFWEVASGKPSSPLPPLPRNINFGSFLTPTYLSRDGKLAAAIGNNYHIVLWHPATSRVIHDIAKPPASSKRLALSPDDSMLATTHQDGTIRFWDTTTGRQLSRLGDAKSEIKPDFYYPIFASDGKTLVAAARHDGTIRRWDVKTGRESHRLRSVSKNIHSLALSPDGSFLASFSTVSTREHEMPRNICQFWDLKTGEEMFQPPIGGDSFAVSPDGKTLATGDFNAIRLWEIATGRERRRFEGHRGTAYSLAFSADGRLLASGGSDSTALVWDVTSLPDGDALPTEHQALWDLLASPNAARAYKAMCFLIADRVSATFLRKQLHAVAIPDRARIARLVVDLDSDRFAVRDRATRELEELGELAVPALRKALVGQPSLEMRRRVEQILQKRRGPLTDPKRLQELRGVEVLEHIGTAEARKVLEVLAGGASETRLTQEAKASLSRLAARSALRP